MRNRFLQRNRQEKKRKTTTKAQKGKIDRQT